MAEERAIESAAAEQSVQRRRSKTQLQNQMNEARESISQTVGEIKETVEEQYAAVKKTIDGVLDWREQFQKDPIVWSVGALSAGFALGYTLGYTHKNVGRSRQPHSEVAAFANSLIDELSTVGKSLVMPSLNSKIRELFGFDFADMLEEIGSAKNPAREDKTMTTRATRKRRSNRSRARRSVATGDQASRRLKARSNAPRRATQPSS
jgi:hypothetical protein